LLRVLPAVIAVALLAPGSAAADPVLLANTINATIRDASSTRILYRQNDGQLFIKDLAAPEGTPPTAVGFNAADGAARLVPGGALYAVLPDENALFEHLYEFRGGTTTDLGVLNGGQSLAVAGNYAIWSNGPTLKRRDVTTGTNVTIATDAGNTDNDVAANGDVVYWTGAAAPDPYVVKHWHSGSATTVSGPTADWSTYPRTDGTTTVFRRTPPCCEGGGSIVFNDGSDETALSGTTTSSPLTPEPDQDYRVAGGWIAYTAADRTEVRTRSPGGTEATITPAPANTKFLSGLSPAGQVAYERDDGSLRTLLLGSAGERPFPVETQALQPSFAPWHPFWESGHWYVFWGSLLKRLDIDTAITAAPPHLTSNPSARFEFASSSPKPDFTCTLDGDDVPCPDDSLTPTVADGEHTLEVKSTDHDTHEADVTDASVTWTVDTSPPDAFALSAPADGARVFDSKPALSWQAASDGGSGIASYRLTLDGHATTLAPDQTSFTPASALADGPHTWRVTATNRVGLERDSQERTFTVDTTPDPTAHMFVDSNPLLTGQSEHIDADNSGAGATYGWHYEWDLDGDGSYETDTGTTGTVDTVYDTTGDHQVGVRVTASGGRTATDTVVIHVTPAPLDGAPGISIDDGAQYTNDPDVTITARWPRYASSMLASNDGGFVDAESQELSAHFPWRLDSSGAERLPKTVYVRFSGGQAGNETYSDDIILDETAPEILTATLKHSGKKGRYVAHVRGRDGVSGLGFLQVTANRAHPGAKHRYVRRLGLRSSHVPRWTRVIDRAGNRSRWHRLKLIRLR
jgi:hypothetical protein